MAEKTAEQSPAQAAHEVGPVDLAASQLSAMIDGELPNAETHLVLRRLSRDGEVQQRWERYHLISDALQGHLPAAFDAGFAARISEAIHREPLPQPVARSLPAWYKPVTGLALAASVVLAALFGLQLAQPDAELMPSPALAAAPISPPPLPVQVVAFNPPANHLNPPSEARLNSYLVNHNGQASRNSVNGMLPYVRMVGYQTQR